MSDRRCIDCGAPAEWALVNEDGTLEGHICERCDKRRRRRRMGWRRRVRSQVKRLLGL